MFFRTKSIVYDKRSSCGNEIELEWNGGELMFYTVF